MTIENQGGEKSLSDEKIKAVESVAHAVSARALARSAQKGNTLKIIGLNIFLTKKNLEEPEEEK